MLRIETVIDIQAPAERVWSVLMDFSRYALWNPFIRSLEGEPRIGAVLSAFIQPPGSKGMRFTPTVLAMIPQCEFRWSGKLLHSRLFNGEHYFLLESAPQVVRFSQGEVFTGLLVPFLKKTLQGSTLQGFRAMNEALKQEAEKP